MHSQQNIKLSLHVGDRPVYSLQRTLHTSQLFTYKSSFAYIVGTKARF